MYVCGCMSLCVFVYVYSTCHHKLDFSSIIVLQWRIYCLYKLCHSLAMPVSRAGPNGTVFSQTFTKQLSRVTYLSITGIWQDYSVHVSVDVWCLSELETHKVTVE